MAMRVMKHLGGSIEARNVFVLDRVTVCVLVDITRSVGTPTPEVAEQRLKKALQDLAAEMVMTGHEWLRTRVPEGILVEVFVE